MAENLPKIAILGWGSLIWDARPVFDKQHGDWQSDGPTLPLEFSRVSTTRDGALTLVIDPEYGQKCKVMYAISKRKAPEDAIADLRDREGTVLRNIGFYFADQAEKKCPLDVPEAISAWAKKNKIDVVVWTGLTRNFENDSKCGKETSFSVENAMRHIQLLDAKGKSSAATYVWRAPDFVQTPLRKQLQSEPWFKPDSAENSA